MSFLAEQKADYPHTTLRESELSMWDYLLPPQTIGLLGLLLVMTPLVLLTGKSLAFPLIQWGQSILMPGLGASYTQVPVWYFLKLGGFIILTFFAVIQIMLRLNTMYLQTWRQAFERPHPLHVDYQPDAHQSMVALISWHGYRLMTVLLPPLALTALTIGLCMLEFFVFNQFVDDLSFGLPFQFTIGFFLIMLFGLFTGFSVINSLWVFLNTIFGDIVAVTEPDLHPKKILERCLRIAFKSPLYWLLYPAYLVFWGCVGAELYLLFYTYDISDLVSFRMNYLLVFALEIVTFGLYTALNALKFYAYHQALQGFYEKLPVAFKERFTPPPPVWSQEPV